MKCKNCNKDIPKYRKFCSRSCSATYNNSLHPKRTNGREKPKCKNCNESLSTFQKVYCNNKCQQEHRYKTITIPKILKGEAGISPIKKYLIEQNGFKCFICNQGNTWNDKPLTLQLDHIDGNSDNNKLDNLRLLCPNCHSQTSTYCSKGSGNRYKKYSKRNIYLRKYKNY